MQDHAHGDHVGLGELVGEEVDQLGRDAIREPPGGDAARGDGAHKRLVAGVRGDVRVVRGDDRGEQAGGPAGIHRRPVPREGEPLGAAMEFPREMPSIASMNCSSRAGSA